jgi:hypothetical protein
MIQKIVQYRKFMPYDAQLIFFAETSFMLKMLFTILLGRSLGDINYEIKRF